MRYAAASCTRASHSAALKRAGGRRVRQASWRVLVIGSGASARGAEVAPRSADRVAILPAIAPRAGGDNRTMIRYDVDVGATHRHTFSVELRIDRARCRAAPEPAGVDSGQLPGARVRAPSLGLTAEQGGVALPLRAARQGDLAGRAAPAARRSSSATRSTPSTPRCAPPFSTPRAASSTAPASACASRAAKASRTRSRCAACRPAGRSRRRSSRGPATARTSSSPPTTTRSSTIRSSSAASGAAASMPPACRTSSSSPAPCPTSTASGCSPTRKRLCEARDRVLARRGRGAVRALPVHAQRARGRPRRARAPRRARRWSRRGATCRGARGRRRARRRRARPRPSDGYVGVLGLIAPRVLPRLERQAAEAARVRDASTTRARTTPRLLWFFEGFTSYYDDLFAAARRPDRRAALPEAAGDDDHRRARRRRAGCVQSVAAGELRCLGQVLPRRREHAERDDQLLRQGLAGRARARPDAARRRQGLARRRHARCCGRRAAAARSTRPTSPPRSRRSAAARSSASSRPGCTAPTSCRCAALLQRFGVEVEAQPATLAQRLGVRVSESALTGVKVSHVLRGGAAERAGVAPATS